jgi:hypothetical protein
VCEAHLSKQASERQCITDSLSQWYFIKFAGIQVVFKIQRQTSVEDEALSGQASLTRTYGNVGRFES